MLDRIVAVACGDVHLSLTPPIARAEEPDWLEAQRRPWDEIEELRRGQGPCPILVAGDLFDKWSAPVELVTWVINNLPNGIRAIPGNHDLPGHSPDLVHRGAYGVLAAAGKIHDITDSFNRTANGLHLYGVALGDDPPKELENVGLFGVKQVCLIHEYLWCPGNGHQGAPREALLSKRARRYSKFDVVVVGDNHRAFMRQLKSGTTVVNCGTLMRRKSDEARYRPSVALIYASGKVELHELECSKHDVISELVHEERDAAGEQEVSDFLDEISGSRESDVDFEDALTRALRKARPRVRRIVLEALEGKGKK